MGEVISLPARHDPAPAASRPKSTGSACFPTFARARETTKNFSAGTRPRAFQLLTAGEVVPQVSAADDVPPSATTISSTVRSIAVECSHFVNMSSRHGLAIVTTCELRPNRGMSTSPQDISERLKALELAVADSAAELCREAGLAANRWSQYKSGHPKRQITLEAARKLKKRYGATLEWIFDGEIHTLPPTLAKSINKAIHKVRQAA